MKARDAAEPSEIATAKSEDQIRKLVRWARRTGKKFAIPPELYETIKEEAAIGDELARDCLEVVCVVQDLRPLRKSA
jgi:hypothetical protein